jgi:hypothetical protein
MTRAVPAFVATGAAWICACSTPTPQIVLGLAGLPTQACPDDCANIPLPCDAVMSIRIVEPGADPDDVNARYLDQCVPVLADPQKTICALNSVSLDSTLIPVRDLAVQIAVFPGRRRRSTRRRASGCARPSPTARAPGSRSSSRSPRRSAARCSTTRATRR